MEICKGTGYRTHGCRTLCSWEAMYQLDREIYPHSKSQHGTMPVLYCQHSWTRGKKTGVYPQVYKMLKIKNSLNYKRKIEPKPQKRSEHRPLKAGCQPSSWCPDQSLVPSFCLLSFLGYLHTANTVTVKIKELLLSTPSFPHILQMYPSSNLKPTQNSFLI